MAANSQLTPEFVLNFFKNFTVFSLNGRDLANVKNADETIYDFFKVKSSYDVSSANGTTTITRTAVSNMTDDDLKAILKKQMSQAGQEVDDTQLEQIWGQLKAMGMTSCTIDMNDVSNLAMAAGSRRPTQRLPSRPLAPPLRSTPLRRLRSRAYRCG